MNIPNNRRKLAELLHRTKLRFSLLLAFALLSAATPALFSQASFDFNVNDGGFSVVSSGPVESVWTYGATAGAGGSGAWFVNGSYNDGALSNSALVSPVLYVVSAGSTSISFNH